VAVSFIGGENRSTLRKPLTCRKSLKINNIIVNRIFNVQLLRTSLLLQIVKLVLVGFILLEL